MRQTELIPCECKKCFFCLNKLTSDIARQRKHGAVTTVIHQDNKSTKTVGCTDMRVNLDAGCDYCKQCYRERTGTREQKLYKIPNSRLGCPNCGEHICKTCWVKGYDMHEKPRAKQCYGTCNTWNSHQIFDTIIVNQLYQQFVVLGMVEIIIVWAQLCTIMQMTVQ